jgi:hypothetical protein
MVNNLYALSVQKSCLFISASAVWLVTWHCWVFLLETTVKHNNHDRLIKTLTKQSREFKTLKGRNTKLQLLSELQQNKSTWSPADRRKLNWFMLVCWPEENFVSFVYEIWNCSVTVRVGRPLNSVPSCCKNTRLGLALSDYEALYSGVRTCYGVHAMFKWAQPPTHCISGFLY